MRGVLLALVAATACRPSVEFHCADTSQCTLGTTQGTCEPEGFCSFPDSSCESQRRFDETAGSGLADACVAGQPGCEAFASHLFSACALTAPDTVGFSAGLSYSYDTDTDMLAESDEAIAHGSIVLQQADGSRVRALSLASLGMPAGTTLTVGGSLPLILASWGDATIAGTITVLPSASPGGCAAAAGTAAPDATSGAGGGGGGGNQGFGGTGGSDDPVLGGTGGGTIAAPTTLRGGCPGAAGGASTTAAGGTGGAGGNAILISANGSLSIAGAVSAGGGGGASGSSSSGAGGGGAGGMIGLDATSLAIAGSVVATGGGGGGASSAGAPATDTGSNAAAGGSETACAPAGGSGAAQALDGASVVDNSTCGGPGGGGGDGYILTFATPMRGSGAIVVPAATPQ
jgi:hypothetical protein|nr:hypothetical protein [Kofleriaceae bacterium]